MDRFRTPVELSPSPCRVSYTSRCLFLGSCFAEEIGRRMLDHKFPVMINPFGTLFNPLSVSAGLDILLNCRPYAPEDLAFHNGLWFSFDHSTLFAHPDRQVCLDNINQSLQNASDFLQSGHFLFITLGTAWIYRLADTDRLVANCHKLPASRFTRHLLEPEEIVTAYTGMLTLLQKRFPDLQVVFTLSPVRHLKDGAVNNQLGKAILLLSIHRLCKAFDRVQYFPAYELFMDELRDYRFYAPDMIHPGEQGSSYLWERFSETYFSGETRTIVEEVEKLLKSLSHRPVHPGSPQWQEFIAKTQRTISELSARFPFLDFSREWAMIREQSPS